MAAKRRTTKPSTGSIPAERVTYRELRNTPGRVWERLSEDLPVTLVADGEAKALLIPLRGRSAAEAWDAFLRGRAMLATARIQRRARETGREAMSLDDINRVIASVRAERRTT